MTTIQIFDPAACCSSGCNADADRELARLSADIDWTRQQGAAIERFNPSQQPMAFTENATVQAFLERSGADALPLTLVDGEVALAGRYPNRNELVRWAGVPPQEAAEESSCCGGCC